MLKGVEIGNLNSENRMLKKITNKILFMKDEWKLI